MLQHRRIHHLDRHERELVRNLHVKVQPEAFEMALGGFDHKADFVRVGTVKVHREPRQRLLTKLDEVDKDTRAQMSGADSGSGDYEDENLVVRSTDR